jgi:hypothetical protein
MAGAPLGSSNAAKGRRWRDAINKALARYSRDAEDCKINAGEALDKLAELVVKKALAGDKDSITEIACRLDGKPAQSLTILGDEDSPLQHNHTVEFVGASAVAAKAKALI